MKFQITGIALLMVGIPAVAHDFWIQPSKFQVDPGTSVNYAFQVGHGRFRDRWKNNQRIVSLKSFHRGVSRDLRPQLRPSGNFDFTTSGTSPGLYVIAMQSNHATSELPAVRFNDYAREEGILPILESRKTSGAANAPGRERYSRRAKALIQVGQVIATGQTSATRPIGLKLEIVPDRDPYALGANRMLPVHVLYDGRRLPNATVKLTNLGADERPAAVAITDRTGRARFRVPASGTWLMNVIWSEPIRNDPKVDFDTTFSSLTFGYDKAVRRR